MKKFKGYNDEKEFSKELKNFLNEEFDHLVSESTSDQVGFRATHQRPKRTGKRPDVSLIFNGKLKIKWREVRPPILIECKMSKYKIRGNLCQFFRYKYDKDSIKRKELKKYGDFHVAAVCPSFLNKGISCNLKWGSPWILTRYLWKLGIGVMDVDTKYGFLGDYKLRFNEQEVINFE